MSPIITAVVQLVEQNILQNFVLNKEFLIQDFVLTRTLSQAESRFAFVPPVPLSFLAWFSLLLLVGLHPGHPPAESTSRRIVAGRIGLWLGRVPYKSRPETSLSPPGPLLWAVSRQPLWQLPFCLALPLFVLSTSIGPFQGMSCLYLYKPQSQPGTHLTQTFQLSCQRIQILWLLVISIASQVPFLKHILK